MPVSGQIAHGLGDAKTAVLDDADGETPEPGHVLRTVPGADTAAFLIEAPGEVAAHCLDRPMSTIEGERRFGVAACEFRLVTP